MHVEPMKSKLKAPGTKRLILECDELVSNFAFEFNFCRYNKVEQHKARATGFF